MNNRIQQTFAELQAKGEKALIPYLMAGDPNLATTEALIRVLEKGGADIIELGVPFSDPIADGPVIQQAAERSLAAGTSLKKILHMINQVRTQSQIPLVLMTYYNSILAMGLSTFCAEAVQAGVDGVIVPDLPPEESETLYTMTQQSGGPTIIFLLAPTSTPKRRRTIIQRTHGFIYYVSLTGITGARLADMDQVQINVQAVKKISRHPIAVGFGISTPEQAKTVAQFADGVIVGSTLVKTVAEHFSHPDFHETIEHSIRSLKSALT